MKKEELEQQARNLAEKIQGINNWIKEHPQVTDPNAYEIMQCNVEFAEILGQYQPYAATESFIDHPEFMDCYTFLSEMDGLRDTRNHPFFATQEAKSLYLAVKESQLGMNYQVPVDPVTRQIKKELLCKSMSVPFYIWQTQRNEPDYQYDNAVEFSTMKDMLATYQADGNQQFVPQMKGLFDVIKKNYKYSDIKSSTTEKTV